MSNYAIPQPQLDAIIPPAREAVAGAPMHAAVLARRAAGLVMDVFVLLVVILSIPFVILAFGIPIAIIVKLLLWIGGLQ